MVVLLLLKALPKFFRRSRRGRPLAGMQHYQWAVTQRRRIRSPGKVDPLKLLSQVIVFRRGQRRGSGQTCVGDHTSLSQLANAHPLVYAEVELDAGPRRTVMSRHVDVFSRYPVARDLGRCVEVRCFALVGFLERLVMLLDWLEGAEAVLLERKVVGERTVRAVDRLGRSVGVVALETGHLRPGV